MSKGDERKIQRLQRQIRRLEDRLEFLDEKADALSEQINHTTNASDRKDLKRQLEDIDEQIETAGQEIDEKEEELKSLQADSSGAEISAAIADTLLSLQKLGEILSPYESALKPILPVVVELCLPMGWQQPMQTRLKGILLDLDDVQPDAKGWRSLAKFAALLIAHPQSPQAIHQPLIDWGLQQTQDFDVIRAEMKTQLLAKLKAQQQTQACLMIVVEETLTKPDRYWVEGYLIPDTAHYKAHNHSSYERLESDIKGKADYSRDDLAKLSKGYLRQCDRKAINHLIIEVFLPRSLLQLAVETWERKGFNPDFPMRVGCDYQVCIRSTERWKEYGSFHQERWEDKWQQLGTQLDTQAHTLVADINEGTDYGDLLTALGDMLAFKLGKAPADNTIFNAVLETTVPVGLWLRQDLPYPPAYQIRELKTLLACCLRELPQRVQMKRAETRQQEHRSADCHIGHHLVLLWEDPHRLPPTKPEYAPDL